MNAPGSLALGLLVYEAAGRGLLTAEFRILLGTGFLSSLATYRTFAVQPAALSPALLAGTSRRTTHLGSPV